MTANRTVAAAVRSLRISLIDLRDYLASPVTRDSRTGDLLAGLAWHARDVVKAAGRVVAVALVGAFGTPG